MGAVLLQQSHPIVYFSKIFCSCLQCASTYVGELYAITTVVREWCPYLLGHSFIILTNHRSLKDLMSHVIQTPVQQTYLSKLLQYDYIIKYKSGPSNIVADALSQIPVTGDSQLLVLFLFPTSFSWTSFFIPRLKMQQMLNCVLKLLRILMPILTLTFTITPYCITGKYGFLRATNSYSHYWRNSIKPH